MHCTGNTYYCLINPSESTKHVCTQQWRLPPVPVTNFNVVIPAQAALVEVHSGEVQHYLKWSMQTHAAVIYVKLHTLDQRFFIYNLTVKTITGRNGLKITDTDKCRTAQCNEAL